MRFTKVVKLRGGLQWMKDKQIYRSRRVLTQEEAALMGKGTPQFQQRSRRKNIGP